MLRIIFNDLDNLLEPNTMDVLMEHLDSGPTEDFSTRLLKFIRCHKLLLIESYFRVVMETCVDPACVAIFASFWAEAFDGVPSVRAPAYWIIRAVHLFQSPLPVSAAEIAIPKELDS